MTAAARRAKLVCTLGPATQSPEAVAALVAAGMDVARVNFSHGKPEEHRQRVALVREAAAAAGREVAVLADLSGPKVRLGMLAQDIYLTTGQAFVLRPGDDRTGDASGAGVTHAGLSDDLKPGDRVLLSDGAVELVVRESGNEIRCEVVKSLRKSRIRSGAGVNVPAERLSLPPITAKDRADLQRCVELGVDVIGQSFVRSAEDVEDLRALLGQERIPIVAKIENRSAVEDADRITLVADGIMVARGDLGVEIPLEEIPIVQKELVRRARATGTPSIVATQMLESMISSGRPTRAEVSDAANAILDGADGVLLSAETAIGRYPIEAAETAATVIRVAEERGEPFRAAPPAPVIGDDARAIAQAACGVARAGVGVQAIACYTRTGRTASLIAADRPDLSIYAFSSEPATVRQLAMVWGVTPFLSESPADSDGMIAMMDRELIELLGRGATVVLVAAAPVGHAHTNLMKVHHLGSPAYGRSS